MAEERCVECEEGLRDRLVELNCKGYPPEKRNYCRRVVAEFFKRESYTPEEYVEFMKSKGLWEEEGK